MILTKKQANIILIFADIFAIGCLIYLFREHRELMLGIEHRTEPITLHTGVYYLLGMLFFPLFRLIQLYSLIKKLGDKLPGQLYLVYFIIGVLIFSAIFPWYFKKVIADAGYHQCGETVTYRTSRGSKHTYFLSACPEFEGEDDI